MISNLKIYNCGLLVDMFSPIFETILALSLLLSASYKERRLGVHQLKVNPTVTFQFLKENTKGSDLYEEDPEFRFLIKEVAKFKYYQENISKYQEGYFTEDQTEEMLDHNFRLDWELKSHN